jgi:hypothetical protein
MSARRRRARSGQPGRGGKSTSAKKQINNTTSCGQNKARSPLALFHDDCHGKFTIRFVLPTSDILGTIAVEGADTATAMRCPARRFHGLGTFHARPPASEDDDHRAAALPPCGDLSDRMLGYELPIARDAGHA